MTIITMNPNQITHSLLKNIKILFGQTTSTTLSWHTESQTSESNQFMYILHPLTGELVEINSDQLWFWSEEWQIGERQVEADLLAGDYEDFENMDDFFKDM